MRDKAFDLLPSLWKIFNRLKISFNTVQVTFKHDIENKEFIFIFWMYIWKYKNHHTFIHKLHNLLIKKRNFLLQCNIMTSYSSTFLIVTRKLWFITGLSMWLKVLKLKQTIYFYSLRKVFQYTGSKSSRTFKQDLENKGVAVHFHLLFTDEEGWGELYES